MAGIKDVARAAGVSVGTVSNVLTTFLFDDAGGGTVSAIGNFSLPGVVRRNKVVEESWS